MTDCCGLVGLVQVVQGSVAYPSVAYISKTLNQEPTASVSTVDEMMVFNVISTLGFAS